MGAKKNVRQAVLEAAMDLVQAEGPFQLTLDAVATRAKVSKGGLLHHFRTKEALLHGMVGEITSIFVGDARSALEASRKNSAAAYLRHSFAGLGSRDRSAMALLAVAAHQRELLQPIRDFFNKRAADILRNNEHPIPTLAVMLLADGLWLFDALDIAPFTGALRDQVLDSVLAWIKAEGAHTRRDRPRQQVARKTPTPKRK